MSVLSRTSMTTGSQAFFSPAAPRSRRASCSGVMPLDPFVATNLSIIPIKVMRRDVPLDRRWHLAAHRLSCRYRASQLAARNVRRAHVTDDHTLRSQADRLELGRHSLRLAAVHDHDRGKSAYALGLMPRAEQSRRVPAQDQEQLVVWKSAVQLLERVHRVRGSAALDLDVGNLKARLALTRELGHGKPVLRRRLRRAAMRRFRAWDEQHTIEMGVPHSPLCRGEMSQVNRVESSAENTDPGHGWYSNSTPEMRTVSPGCTPSASSAALTPSLSSSDWNRASAPSDS